MPTANAKNKQTRGYRKIAEACQHIGIDFRRKTVLDIGSSTGGFTQYALEHGAKRVIAVEKGTNQMAVPLRLYPKVELHEKTDIFSVSIHADSPNKLIIPPSDIIIADVSFISLTRVLLYAKDYLVSPQTKLLVMLKPQFEAKSYQLVHGVVKNSKIRRTIIKDFEVWLKTHGFAILNKTDNYTPGRAGNQERFYYLRLEQ